MAAVAHRDFGDVGNLNARWKSSCVGLAVIGRPSWLGLLPHRAERGAGKGVLPRQLVGVADEGGGRSGEETTSFLGKSIDEIRYK